MATATPATPAPKPVAPQDQEIRIISHSTLYYWWIVWAVGFIMALFTAISDYVLAVVPKGTVPYARVELGGQGIDVNGDKIQLNGLEGKRDILVTLAIKDAEKGKDAKDNRLLKKDFTQKESEPLEKPHLAISKSKTPGVLFCTVLLIVIFITNVPLRGLWSVIVILFIVLMSIILGLLEAWESIMQTLTLLDIRINLGGYLFISSVLFALWLVVFLLFDQQIYMVFTPGQLRVRLEIGDAETAYDTTGMTIQKQRSDIFRHWILGLGSGDLIVKTSGAQSHTFDMPNVLFLGRKVKQIEDLMKSRTVVTSTGGH